jgi:CheY-like chemotaxis protein
MLEAGGVGTGVTAESKVLTALFTRPKRLLLRVLFSEPNRWWTLTELCGCAGVQGPALQRQLDTLRAAGLIREGPSVSVPAFQPDPNCPVFNELQAMVNKLTGITDKQEMILVVEDQPATAQITRILLESWGYRVLEAHDGREALLLFTAHRDEIRLILTDVIMPGMDGPTLVNELHRTRPDLRAVYMSGYSGIQPAGERSAFLAKPFNPAGLARAIRHELERPAVRRAT